jgi:hypothetical protein
MGTNWRPFWADASRISASVPPNDQARAHRGVAGASELAAKAIEERAPPPPSSVFVDGLLGGAYKSSTVISTAIRPRWAGIVDAGPETGFDYQAASAERLALGEAAITPC